MANEIFSTKVREIIAELLDIDIADVVDEADIIDDLGADSIDVIDLIVRVEEEFNIKIPDSDVINNRIIGDIIEYIVNVK